MRSMVAIPILLLAACAAEQQITLLPRAPETQRGSGVLDRVTHDTTVTVGARTYRGKTVFHSATTTSWGLFGPKTATTASNQASALLLGDAGGQLRCEFAFDQMYTMATGVCVDSRNITFDILIKK